MELEDLQKHWHKFGEEDPLWAILTVPEMKGNNWDRDAFFREGIEEIDSVFHQIESLNLEVKFGRALDFGCGVGRLTQALAAHFDEAHGVDIAPSMIEAARRFNQYGEKCQYHLNSKNDLHIFPDEHFDFIYSVIVLQHMAPRFSKAYILDFLRLLKPNGLLVFQLPSELKEKPAPPDDRHSPPAPTNRNFMIHLMNQAYTRIRQAFKRSQVPFEPKMEMHGIPKNDMFGLLIQNQATVHHVLADGWAGPPWNSYTYYVTKRE